MHQQQVMKTSLPVDYDKDFWVSQSKYVPLHLFLSGLIFFQQKRIKQEGVI